MGTRWTIIRKRIKTTRIKLWWNCMWNIKKLNPWRNWLFRNHWFKSCR